MLKKITAVFLPGKLCDQRLWAVTMAALSDIIDPIFVDLRSQNSLEEMILEISNCCEGKFILIGFSMGGYVAQEFILKYPERVLGLALLGSSADGYSELEKSYQTKLMDNARNPDFQVLPDVYLRKIIHSSRYNDEALIDLIKDMASSSGVEAFISQHKATIDRHPSLDNLSNINCRAILIASEDDQIAPLGSMKKMASVINKAEFYSVKNCGHMIPLEQADILNSLLRPWVESF